MGIEFQKSQIYCHKAPEKTTKPIDKTMQIF